MDRMGVLQAYGTGEHVVLRWFDRTYHGHITEVDAEGFRLEARDGDGLWSDWDADFEVEEPWWDLERFPCSCPFAQAKAHA